MGRRALIGLAVWVAATGCSRSETATSATAATTVDAHAPTTGSASPASTTTTAPPATPATASPTTAPASTATTTTAPPTTAPPPTATTTTAPPTTAPPTTTAALATPATALAVYDPALVEVDVATGAPRRTIDEFFSGEGVFRGGLTLTGDGAAAYFSEAYEDGWYACGTSIGSIGRIELATGSIEIIGAGSGVTLSPDGGLLAYLTSEVCEPDPQNPDVWVLTPTDRVVVRDLATGGEIAYVTSPAPTEYSAPSEVTWAGFSPAGNLLVLTAAGDLRAVDPAADPAVDAARTLHDHPVVLSGVDGPPIVAAAESLVVRIIGDEGSHDLVSIDAESGVRTPLASSERWMSVGVDDGTGRLLVAGFAEITVEPGAPVTVLTVPDDAFIGALDW